MSPVTIFPTTLVWGTGDPSGTAWGSARRVRCGTRLEVHHVIKRAQGGLDFDLDHLVALCPPCHAETEAPYLQGRLVIIPLGNERFHRRGDPGG